MDDCLIKFLAEKAKEGFKVDKTFKKVALVAAASEVSKKCGDHVTIDNLINHLNWVKKKFGLLKEALKLSGAGWDPEKKILKLEGPGYDRFLQDNGGFMKSMLNTPLDNYDDLAMVCGDDFASGDGVKSVYMGFGTRPNKRIMLDDEPDQVIHVEDNEPKTVPLPNFSGVQLPAKKPKASSKKANLEEEREVVVQKLLGGMTTLADSIRSGSEHWTEKLANVVNGMIEYGYDEDFLGCALDKLMRDEVDGRCFIYKTIGLRKQWLNCFMKDLYPELGEGAPYRSST